MSIVVDKDILQHAILIADAIVSSKNVNTILSNCLFHIYRDSIEIVSTDNEIGIRTRLDAISDGEIFFTANGKRFAGILKELPKGEVVIDISENYQIDIKTKAKDIKANYTLVGTSKDEYPEIPFFYDDNVIEINQSVLRDMFRKVLHAAATDTIKPVFNGVYLVSDTPGMLTVVATDSRRLAIISRMMENDIQISDGVIIPLKTVSEVVRLLEPTGNCRFSLFENQCFFKIGETEIVSRIIDGQFPNYRQVIPKEQGITAVVETKKINDSLRRAMVFTREPVNKVLMHVGKNSLVLETKTPELGESTEEIPLESNAEGIFSIGVNAQFLMDTLKEIDTFSMNIGFTGQMSPITISPENDDRFISVIMPIQIKSA